jgi:hypothetical protein
MLPVLGSSSMREIEMTAAQAEVIATWSERGEHFLPLVLHAFPPSYAFDWSEGDLLVTQGDAHLHLASSGRVKDVVPPASSTQSCGP